MKKGFTLVELSIVLVIIGLLIGGILAAQSMITTTKVGAAVRAIGQYDAAVASFQARYNSLPGDSKKLTPQGDENGNIGNMENLFAGEVANFWVHMQLAGFKNPGTLTETVTGSFNASASAPNAPKFPLGKNASVLAMYSPGTPDNYNNYYIEKIGVLDGTEDIDGGGHAAAAFTPADAAAVDTKMDDGTPLTGVVTQIMLSGDVVDVNYGLSCTDGGAAPGKYVFSTKVEACILSIRMLSQTGQ